MQVPDGKKRCLLNITSWPFCLAVLECAGWTEKRWRLCRTVHRLQRLDSLRWRARMPQGKACALVAGHS